MWLTCSSIGRKFVMAIMGVCLVLFVTFHVLMNSVALLWPSAYNVICEFLGANWYALIASAGLALLFIIHIIYACWLTIQNRQARGADRYKVNTRPKQVEWSSKNMFVLGVVIVAFFIIHLIQFWSKMQLPEALGRDIAMEGDIPAIPHFGTLFLQFAFSQVWTLPVYLIGFAALWLHMNHGFWSMFHTIGWSNNVWFNRLKCISCWWTSIVILLFAAQAVLFTVQANNKFFLEDPTLQEQYLEYCNEKADALLEDYQAEASSVQMANQDNMLAAQDAMMKFLIEKGPQYKSEAEAIQNYASVLAPTLTSPAMAQMKQFGQWMERQIEYATAQQANAPKAAQPEAVAEDSNEETTSNE